MKTRTIYQLMVTTAWVNAKHEAHAYNRAKSEGREHLSYWDHVEEIDTKVEQVGLGEAGLPRWCIKDRLEVKKIVQGSINKELALKAIQKEAPDPLEYGWWEDYESHWWIIEGEEEYKPNIRMKEFDICVHYHGSTIHTITAASLDEAINIAREESLNMEVEGLEITKMTDEEGSELYE